MTATSTEAQDLRDMERLVAGHDAGLNDLMDRHGERLLKYLQRIVRSKSDANDIAQEAFVRVYQKRERFKPGKRFSTWLYTIATNLALDCLRRRRRRPEVSLDAECDGGDNAIGEFLPDPGRDPGASLVREETSEIVCSAIGSLSEDLRLPLVLAEYEGQTHAEIGLVIGCSAKAIEMRIYRARRILRERLAHLLAEQ